MPHQGSYSYSTGGSKKKKKKEPAAYKPSGGEGAMVKRAMDTLKKSGMFTVTRKKKTPAKKKGNPDY